MKTPFHTHRLIALMRKEALQIIRDPSVMIITFILPPVLLFLFAFAVSLDIKNVRIGVVLQSESSEALSLAAAYNATAFLEVHPARSMNEAERAIVAGNLHGIVVIPPDFDRRLAVHDLPLVQIITDGSQPNTANFVESYTQGVLNMWLNENVRQSARITLEPRFWFNPEIDSRRALLPGAIAIVMTVIGTLLTALVIAREWERGTMEALISTPASIANILLGKLLPYWTLGMIATVGCALLAIFFFGVPMRGSWFALLLMTAGFLFPALGQGLLISALARNQFVASQIALLSGFLPAFMLSGFLYEIDSMPLPIQWISVVVPARYFVTSLRAIFLSGDVWPLLLPNLAMMLVIGSVFFLIARFRTRKSLEI